jgi:hypothetical protein
MEAQTAQHLAARRSCSCRSPLSSSNRVEQEELARRDQFAAGGQDQPYALSGWDSKGLLDLIRWVRTRVAQEVGRAVEMVSCYEAGYDGFWLRRLLEDQGVRCLVVDAARM